MQLSALWDQCDSTNSNSLIRELKSWRPTSPELDGRKGSKKPLQAGLVTSRVGNQLYILQSELTLPLQASVKTSTGKNHQQDKGRRHFLHWGDQHLHNTEDCGWEMTCSYLTKSFWVLPESTSLAKLNWRGTWTTPAEEKGYCLRANLKVTLRLTSCQENTRQVRTGGFPGGQRTLFAVQVASCS